jgi:hypothetical protein
MSVRNYHYTLRNNPEQRSSQANTYHMRVLQIEHLHTKWPLGLLLWFQVKPLDVV